MVSWWWEAQARIVETLVRGLRARRCGLQGGPGLSPRESGMRTDKAFESHRWAARMQGLKLQKRSDRLTARPSPWHSERLSEPRQASREDQSHFLVLKCYNSIRTVNQARSSRVTDLKISGHRDPRKSLSLSIFGRIHLTRRSLHPGNRRLNRSGALGNIEPVR